MENRFLRYIILAFFAFVAQIIDGGIGMGYGVSLTSLLLTIGFGSAISSALVHLSEIFTTLVSGVSHFYFGNFDRKIFKYLVIPGIIGGIAGAFSAVEFQNASFIKPLVSTVLLLLGILIIIKYLSKKDFLIQEYTSPKVRHLVPLGFLAAFVDAIGGGGWGPISTPVLVIKNADPKKVIGSVNFAEFFVTLAISASFLIALPEIDWKIVGIMVTGGVVAAPIAALITKKMPQKTLGVAVGILIVFLSLRTILKSIGVGFIF
jgi:uncharacterized protein